MFNNCILMTDRGLRNREDSRAAVLPVDLVRIKRWSWCGQTGTFHPSTLPNICVLIPRRCHSELRTVSCNHVNDRIFVKFVWSIMMESKWAFEIVSHSLNGYRKWYCLQVFVQPGSGGDAIYRSNESYIACVCNVWFVTFILQCLKKWGFRRCEDICWIKTNINNPQKKKNVEPRSIFQRTKVTKD